MRENAYEQQSYLSGIETPCVSGKASGDGWTEKSSIITGKKKRQNRLHKGCEVSIVLFAYGQGLSYFQFKEKP